MEKNLFKETWKLRAFGLIKIPMIFFCSPKLLISNEKEVSVKIPLNYFTKNHLGSMYFGVLAVGADVAGGLIAMNEIVKRGNHVGLVFKDFSAQFLKRPEDDVHFTSNDGEKMQKLVELAEKTGERVEDVVTIVATCPKKNGNEPVATFKLTISLKRKKSKA